MHLPDSLSVALNKADCVQMRVDQSKASAEWVCALLNCKATELKAHRLILGQTRARISMGRLREMKVPVPDLDSQLEFAKLSSFVDAKRGVLASAISELDNLFASLQQRAFRGDL